MKKLLLLLLAICTYLSVGVMLTACGGKKHTHTYKTEWSKDATHHWHACEGENCTDVTNKTKHTWNDGEITTEATTEADGVKTFTCTVCGKTKTEPVEYVANATVTKEEWETAFSFDYSTYQVKISYTTSDGSMYYMEQTVEGNKLQMIEGAPGSPIAIDYMEMGLDSVMEDGLLKDVPIVSTVVALYKVGNSFKERHNLKKLYIFL